MTVMTSERPRSGTVPRLALALLPGFVFMVAFVLRSTRDGSGWRFTLFDDALISMAYGRTLATTGEWVWFPGADRVQGITNPLWSGLMALVHLPGTTPTAAIITVTILSAAAILATAVVAYFIVVSAGAPPVMALAAAGAVPFLYPLTFWSLRGMEVGMLALLTSVLVLAAGKVQRDGSIRRDRWFVLAGVAGCAAVLTRLDAAAVVLVISAVAALLGSASIRRGWLMITAVVLACAGIVLVFQGWYWGDFLPNTYRLKVEGVPLGDRLERGIFATGKAAPLAVFAVITALAARKKDVEKPVRLVAFLATAVTLVVIGYSVWTGGDAWEWTLMLNRTVAIALPLGLAGWLVAFSATPHVSRGMLVLLAASGIGLGLTTNPSTFDVRLALIGLGITTVASLIIAIGSVRLRSHIITAVVMAVAFIVATSAPGGLLWLTQGAPNAGEDQRFAARSEELANVTNPDATIAVMWAGAPGYLADRSVIDMFGKSDRVIATQGPRIDPNTGAAVEFIPGHNKWDYEYSIKELHPDVVFQLGEDRDSADSQILEWGYTRRCLSDGWVSYFLEESTRVRWEQLDEC